MKICALNEGLVARGFRSCSWNKAALQIRTLRKEEIRGYHNFIGFSTPIVKSRGMFRSAWVRGDAGSVALVAESFARLS